MLSSQKLRNVISRVVKIRMFPPNSTTALNFSKRDLPALSAGKNDESYREGNNKQLLVSTSFYEF